MMSQFPYHMKRRKKPKMGVREPSQIRCPAHLQWVRGHECAVRSDQCDGPIQAAHVRAAGDGGTGLKPGDDKTFPLCAFHHWQQHARGEGPFELQHKIDMKALAEQFWQRSPHGKKYRMENEG